MVGWLPTPVSKEIITAHLETVTAARWSPGNVRFESIEIAPVFFIEVRSPVCRHRLDMRVAAIHPRPAFGHVARLGKQLRCSLYIGIYIRGFQLLLPLSLPFLFASPLPLSGHGQFPIKCSFKSCVDDTYN